MKKEMICISGNIAVGKTEVAALLAERLEFKLYKASQTFRQAARDNNMDLVTFNKYVKSNPDIDMKIEEKTKEVVQNENKIIIDARLGFFVAKDAFKVYMTSDINTASNRLFIASKNRGKEEIYDSAKEAKIAIEIREQSERERYIDIYGIDIHDIDNYDYLIDTTNLTPEEVVNKIIKAYKIWIDVDFSEG